MNWIIGFICLIIASVLGIMIHQDSGSVVIHWHQWQIESSVWLWVFLIFFLIFLVYIWLKIWHAALRIPERLHYWKANRRLTQSQKQSERGFCALAEGNWREAEKYLIKGVMQGAPPLMNYMGAARAAYEMGDVEQSEIYFAQASQSSLDADKAVMMTKVQMYIKHGCFDQAFLILEHLHERFPKHKGVTAMLAKWYEHQEDYLALAPLLPSVKKMGVFEKKHVAALENKAMTSQMMALKESSSKEALVDFWEDLPNVKKEDEAYVHLYLEGLKKVGAFDLMRVLVQKHVKKFNTFHLLEYFIPSSGESLHKQIDWLEGLIKKHGEHCDILQCLANHYIVNHTWGLAKEILKQLISKNPTLKCLTQLADVHDALGEKDQALECYQRACHYKVNDTPES